MNQQATKAAGASNPNATNNGRPSGSSAPKTTSTAKFFGVKALKSTMEAVSEILNAAEQSVKEKFNLTELSEAQKDIVLKLGQAVISTTKKEDWKTQLAAVVKEPEKYLATFTRNEISQAVEEIAVEHQVDTFSASLLYHSKWHKQ